MRIKHKNLRHGSICHGPHRFMIDEQGYLNPTPNEVQWKILSGAHHYFIVEHDAAPLPSTEPAAVVEDEPAAPAPVEAEEVYAPADEGDDTVDESETIFSDDVDVDAEAPEASRYSELTLDELRTMCRDRGIKTARVNKNELISLLNASDLGV